MQDCKLVKVPIPVGVRITFEQFPKEQEEIEDMEHVPYSSDVGSLMYVMVCIRSEIFHAVGVLRRYMLTHRKENWTIVKR